MVAKLKTNPLKWTRRIYHSWSWVEYKFEVIIGKKNKKTITIWNVNNSGLFRILPVNWIKLLTLKFWTKKLFIHSFIYYMFDRSSSPESAGESRNPTSSTASNLFRLLIPLMKCENSDMRDTVVNGVGYCNPAVFKLVLHHHCFKIPYCWPFLLILCIIKTWIISLHFH